MRSGFWEVDIDKLADAKGEVVSGAMTRDLTAPRAVGVKEDEEIGRRRCGDTSRSARAVRVRPRSARRRRR